MAREKWSSRTAFILAAVGSAVGLGNAWRFPGLCAKHGGGAFLMVYLGAMLVLGIPLLMMEISIGRKTRQGAPGALRTARRGLEPIGWAATTNAFVIACYYAVVFAWVILMTILSYKFAGLTGNAEAASNLFAQSISTNWGVTDFSTISWPVVGCLVIAWGLIYYCIRNGARSVSKVVKYTVFLPVICLVILVIKGFTMPGALEGMKALFIPDFSALSNAQLWVDAVGQVFFSLSIMMAIMFAYGSFLDRKADIAKDAMIIAFSDMAVSVLAGIVMFTTMYGVGKSTADMSASGISTAFIIYPQTIVTLTNNGVLNAIFGFVFYFCLITLAIDSAFSIVEGVSTAVADKFHLEHRKATIGVCCVAGIVSLFFTTSAGLGWLDIVDNWTNQYSMIVIGILECIGIGWFFKTSKILEEINRNATGFKMPAKWFNITIKFISPLLLAVLFSWNIYGYITNYNDAGEWAGYGYSLWAEIAGGWAIMALVFLSGFIVKAIVKSKKKKGFKENDATWDELTEDED